MLSNDVHMTNNHIAKLKVNQLTMKVTMFVGCNH
jgi:hypothetical protein